MLVCCSTEQIERGLQNAQDILRARHGVVECIYFMPKNGSDLIRAMCFCVKENWVQRSLVVEDVGGYTKK